MELQRAREARATAAARGGHSKGRPGARTRLDCMWDEDNISGDNKTMADGEPGGLPEVQTVHGTDAGIQANGALLCVLGPDRGGGGTGVQEANEYPDEREVGEQGDDGIGKVRAEVQLGRA